MERLHHWIDGRPVAGGDAATVVTGPVDRRPVAEVPLGGPDVVDRAVASARAAFTTWRGVTPLERGRLLAELARRLRHDERFVDEARAGVQVAADYFEYYGGVVRAMLGETIDVGADDHAFTTREPYGVIGLITPWNGPISQAARGVAAAVAVGNTVVVKPSEFTSTTTVMLAELAAEVGFPAGVVNVVLGTGTEAGAALTAHAGVRLVSFTGSVATGRIVARAAAGRLVPTILELGGKSPNVVFDDADLDAAVASAVSVCVGGGQVCSALTRLIVHDAVHDEVVERVGAAMARKTPGTSLMPMTTEAQYRKVLDYFDVAARDGARLVTGGTPVAGALAAGRYVPATVYADVTRAMRIFREEIFGPVLAVSRFATEAEAISLANDSEYGLTAAVWTRDSARALRVASRLDAGQVSVNGGRLGIETPFGGYRSSGFGRQKGFEALRHFTQTRTTVVSLR